MHLHVINVIVLLYRMVSQKRLKYSAGLFLEKITSTVFSFKIGFQEKTQVFFSRTEGPKIQLGVLILKIRFRRDLLKLLMYTSLP